MRKLSPSEFRLLIMFCGAIFFAANLLAIRFWMATRRDFLREQATLQATLAEDQSWMATVGDIHTIKQWLKQHPPPEFAADAASTELLRVVHQSVEAQQLTIASESLLPAENQPQYSSVDLQIKLSGPFAGIVRLLFDLQKPEAWRSMQKINLKSDSSPSDAVVEMQIRQYYVSAESAPPVPEK